MHLAKVKGEVVFVEFWQTQGRLGGGRLDGAVRGWPTGKRPARGQVARRDAQPAGEHPTPRRGLSLARLAAIKTALIFPSLKFAWLILDETHETHRARRSSMKLAHSLKTLFDSKKSRKFTKSDIMMCASVVGVCVLVAVLVLVVRVVVPA